MRVAPAPDALTVLVVQSAPLLGERLLHLVLRRRGVAAALADTIDDAVAQLRVCRYALVAVDRDIDRDPALPGIRAMRSAAPDAFLAVLTTDDDPETVAACRGAGADAVVTVPSGLRRVLAILDELLAARRAG